MSLIRTYICARRIIRLYGGRAWPQHVVTVWQLAKQDAQK